MAFFSIVRYTGDDGEKEKQVKSSAILQKLHEAADRKRKSLQLVSHDSSEQSPKKPKTQLLSDSSKHETSASSKKKKKKKIHDHEELKSSEERNISDSPKKPSKRERKRVDSDAKDIDSEGKSDTNSPADSRRKQRKGKKGAAQEEDSVLAGQDERPGTNLGEASYIDDNNVDHSSSDDDQVTEDEDDEEDGKDENQEEAFTVLGQTPSRRMPSVQRVLPQWLTEPTVITDDIRGKRTPLQDVPGLDQHLLEKLTQNGIKDFFPVQGVLLPELLKSFNHSYRHGIGGFQPSDICCSAPTGSGKTLAYVLPVVQALKSRVVPQIRVLVVLPVRDLVKQVYNVFTTYCSGSGIKVVQILGAKSFTSEQQMLVHQGPHGYENLCDILVSTPGRLVDHINKTPGFSLKHLRFLIIDEADRMMDEIKQDWLRHVENAVYSGNHGNTDVASTPRTVARQQDSIYGDICRDRPGVLTVGNACQPRLVLQKLLFSATLSQNPEKLQQLNLFQPKLFTSVVQGASSDDPVYTMRKEGEFIGKFTTPAGLSELYIKTATSHKPLIICRFIQTLNFRQILCFTNTVESAHRLYWLIKLMCDVEVREISSLQLTARRDRILKQFKKGTVQILVCSDAIARGIDIENVKYVISYECPPYLKTYVHRVGRTARAGKIGTAITLLDNKEVRHFKKMLKEAGKEGVREMEVSKSELKPFTSEYTTALTKLKQILQKETRRR